MEIVEVLPHFHYSFALSLVFFKVEYKWCGYLNTCGAIFIPTWKIHGPETDIIIILYTQPFDTIKTESECGSDDDNRSY